MYSLKNDKLEIAVTKIGVELCKIQSVKNNLDFMWDANPEIWGSYAPNLFPIIGVLKAGSYIFDNETYKLPKHGFIRHNDAIELDKKTSDSLVFKLKYNKNLLKIYPFKFEFLISYKLIDNKIEITHTVNNIDNKPLYFSLGGHPAFKCPVYNDESYNDYVLEFESVENSKTHLINMENDLLSSRTKPTLNNTNLLPLSHDLFNDDALIFKDLKSRRVSLKSSTHGEILSVEYNDFNYLGIWAKPNGDYVCIEPWLGTTDHEETNQDFTTKEGIIELGSGNTFNASYSIEINNTHLL
ncbi:aldose 1-epimerase family protein [Tamlana sp. 2201CG12-4]|uniref:aldose 1-epimerase family protein n=1 Tax=Tamlana sp. 2201CG12-4 TaxID=3112582 RepID=UPI002DB6D049|nr:aldose 1-epimerase family protein [Tamlana sp. 2201CG12-4]MEC3907748.1 aldose 1-epimerase family protein [Tamlana sp. 2201CG12-4]